MGRDSGVRFHRDVEDIALPAPIALLVYHIAREGVMNALKHAHATDMWIAVREQDDRSSSSSATTASGFDTSAPGPEGHFGMAMMRERAQVGGGTFDVESAPDEGATITVRFPISLLQSGDDATGPDPTRQAPLRRKVLPPVHLQSTRRTTVPVEPSQHDQHHEARHARVEEHVADRQITPTAAGSGSRRRAA